MLDLHPYTKPLILTASLALLWFIEYLAPFYRRPQDKLAHDTGNIVLGTFNNMLVVIFFSAATLAVTTWAQASGVGILNNLPVSGWVEWLLAILLIDIWQYWWHRINHRVKFLWRFHAVHHSDADMNASSAIRFHTVEILMSSGMRLLVLPLAGARVEHVLLYEVLLLPVILFQHSNIRIPYRIDSCFRWLIVTPWMHWVHHSRYQPETDSNYSSLLSVWDRIFSSFRLNRHPETITLGLDQYPDKEWKNLWSVMLSPFKKR